jgi:hypothetical protein
MVTIRPQILGRQVRRREDRVKEIHTELETLRQRHPDVDVADIRKSCGERLARFKDLLLGDVPVARQALRKLLPEPLRIFPAKVDGRKTLRFEGATVRGPLVDPLYQGMASPRRTSGLITTLRRPISGVAFATQ